MAVFDQLIVLQGLDTDLVRINHRLGHLPEADEARRVEAELAAVAARLAQVETELKNAADAVTANEAGVGDIRRQTERLSAQLRTVIAPREAEALQHEIEILRVRASDLDEVSLVEMSRIDELEVDRKRLVMESAALNERAGIARATRDAAAGEMARERDDVVRRRAEAAASVDPAWLRRYDERRAASSGTAIARLAGSTCGGCHIDLSRSEVEALRREVDDARECPNCARWLLVS